MHSSVNNHDTSTSILSITEIIGIVAVFSFVLYLIFPKKNINHIIEAKGKNTNLSINYLESMLLYYPNNIKLEMILLRNYDYANKREKAFKLINKILSQTKDKKILDKVYKTQYRLLKEEYFETNNNKIMAKAKQKLYDYFEFTKENRDYIYFLAEATQMGFSKLQYISIKGLMKNRPKLVSYKLKKEAFYLASSLGYKKEAKNILLNLIEYPQIDPNLKNYALSILLNQKDYPEAIKLATQLFKNTKNSNKKEGYFNIALYATAINSDNNKTEINKIINLYKNSIKLNSHNIYFILDNLLKIGDIKGASHFAITSFKNSPNLFDENCIDLAIKSMVYNQDLAPALDLALFAENKFNNKKWLDKAIQLSIWQGKMKKIAELNFKGYKKYKDKKYEKYLLEKTTLNSGYEILGEIYKKKLEKDRDYTFIEKIAQYFDYTAKTTQGEKYFIDLYKKDKNKDILKQAIFFSYKNNHYKKGLKLYKKYKAKFGIDKSLQQISIEKLISMKRFKEAYISLKDLEKIEKYDKNLQTLLKKLHIEDKFELYTKLIDLAWIYKDYKYIYKILWKLEKQDKLKENGYSKLILLDKELNQSKKITYLYKKIWQKSHKTTYLIALLYIYSNQKDYKSFQKILKLFTKKEKERLNNDINYLILLANYYINTDQKKLAMNSFKKAFKIDKNSVELHQAYLWFLIDNQFKSYLNDEIRLLKNHPKLRKDIGLPAIVGAMLDKENKIALEWIIPHLQSKSEEYQLLYKELKNIQKRKLENLISNYSPSSKIYTDYKKLSESVTAIEQGVSQRLELYKDITSILSITQYRYKIDNAKNIDDKSIKLNLKNSENNFLWDIAISKHNNTLDNFITTSLNLNYKIDNSIIELNSKYQNKTKHTTQLYVTGLENSLTLTATQILTNRLNFSFLYKKANFKKLRHNTKMDIGNLEQLEVISNYNLRTGYPNIILSNYIINNKYSNNDKKLLPKDFIEFGGQLSIGEASQYKLNREFKPFGSIGFAINNHNSIGTNLQLGVSGGITSRDILNIIFNYTKEVDTVNKPYYEIGVEYKF